ncbi:hypothetical protein [Streptacidiphilus cavernicola]|uniref:Uncharacterized protein n=1 Tax=Streptacidiphilus cavernicola TaxID=3342716 RepID=A0ABV6W4F9_9ACTN
MDFEERISQALTEAGHSYDLEPQPLLDRGLRRGFALRRRRVALRVTGAAAALAVISTGAALSPGVLSGHADQAASPNTTSTAKGPSVSGQQILDLLESALPPGKVTQTQAIGAGGGRPAMDIPTAQLVYDDGHGPALIRFGSATENNPDVTAAGTCDPAMTTPQSTCQRKTLADGSTVSFSKNNQNKKTGLAADLQWTATLVTAKGDRIWIDEFNRPTEFATSDGTRTQPPLDADQLTALATKPDWTGLFAAIRASKPDGQLTAAQTLAIAKKTMPAGVTAHGSLADNQEGIANVSCGTDCSLTFDVERWPTDARSEVLALEYGDSTKLLPDGTTLRVATTGGLVLPNGRHSWHVSALLSDGTSVQVVEQYPLTTSVAPLSVAQLKTIVLNPAWAR